MKNSSFFRASIFIAAALPASLFAQSQVLGVTATQAVLQYQAPTSAACQVKVSQNRSYTPLAADVDPFLFLGADQDSRTGSVSSASGNNRYFVVGKKRA